MPTDESSDKDCRSAEIAAGWGMTVANAVYLGVDAQVGNFGIVYNSVEGKTSETTVAWYPNLQARVGYAGKSLMPFIGGGFGYKKMVSKTGETGRG